MNWTLCHPLLECWPTDEEWIAFTTWRDLFLLLWSSWRNCICKRGTCGCRLLFAIREVVQQIIKLIFIFLDSVLLLLCRFALINGGSRLHKVSIVPARASLLLWFFTSAEISPRIILLWHRLFHCSTLGWCDSTATGIHCCPLMAAAAALIMSSPVFIVIVPVWHCSLYLRPLRWLCLLLWLMCATTTSCLWSSSFVFEFFKQVVQVHLVFLFSYKEFDFNPV